METNVGTVLTQRPASSPLMPLLSTKLSMPALRTDFVPRSRLTERLEQHEAQQLAVVVAPAGWGKSSVVSEWCAQQEDRSRSVAWVALDAGDNDLGRFLLYLSATCDRAFPGLGEAVRPLLQASQPSPPEVVLTVLLNEISALARPLTLVLDDYHLIESQAVHAALTFLIEHLPPLLHLIIATRVDPPLPLSRMRVRGQLAEIRANDLRFTRQEAAAFLNQAMGLKLDSDAVARLEARTEGWIAGLQLAAISLQGRANPSEFLDSFTGSNRYIVDYLFDEVLSQQPEPVQTFLQETSLLNRLCGPLCEAVTGQVGGQALLEKLEAGNLFLIPLDDERRWYRYHHLFADVLQARLAQQGEERAVTLHRRAAVWYDAQGIAEEAVHHALASGDKELSAQYIERYSEAMWMRGEQQTMERWMKALPEEMVFSRPRLCVWIGCVYLFNIQPEALSRHLDLCRPKALSEDPQERDLQGQVLALEGFLSRIQGNYGPALAITQKAYACLAEENAQWRGATLLNLGVLYFEAGDLDAAIEAFIESNRLARIGEDLVTVLLSYSCLAEIREEQGALREAIPLYQKAVDYAFERRAGSFPHLCWLYAGLGRIRYQWNDLPGAAQFLQEGVERQSSGVINASYLELIKVKKAQGDAEGMETLLERLKRFATHFGKLNIQDISAALQVWAQPERKKQSAAWLESYEIRTEPRLPLTFPYLPYRERELLTWAQIRMGQGQSEPVRARLESLLENLTRRGRHGTAIEVRALLAILHWQAGRSEQAVAMLGPGLALAAKEGYSRVFLDVGNPLVPALREAAARGVEAEYVAKLLDAFRVEGLLQAEARQQDASPLVDPLSERELEVLRLVATGLSNPEIAEHLFLSVGTIKRHVYNIYGKLEVTGRVEAITRARELDLL